MARLLDEAFAQASKLPESEQESLGAWILAELSSEQRWQTSFASSAEALGRLADEALAEHRERRTDVLEPGGL
jgi:hypothetical protein